MAGVAHTCSLPSKNDPESGNCTGGGGVSAPGAPSGGSSGGVTTPRRKQQEAGVSSSGGGGVGASNKYRYEVCFDNIVDQEDEYTVSISTGRTNTSRKELGVARILI